jgi:ubiquinone/menaquinone biosynthesis C-methylase UbiE
VNKNTLVAKQYNDFNQVYSNNLEVQDEIGNQIFYRKIDFSVDKKKLLDVGCGNGSDAAYFAKQGAVVAGVDPCEKFIASAKEKTPDGVFFITGGENLPFEDKFFDIVVSKYALQTSYNVPKILEEIARVLKPDGMLVYLTKHPLRQFLEKKKKGKNYFKQEIVDSIIYEGLINLKEPSHTLSEYLNSNLLRKFDIVDFEEAYDFPASEQIGGDLYPTFFVMKAIRKDN